MSNTKYEQVEPGPLPLLPEDVVHPPAVRPEMKSLWDKMVEVGCVLANGKSDTFKNKGDTLVFLVPSKEMLGDSLRWLLYAFGKMKADEISVMRCSGRTGYSTIVRMWWD
jgi:hypothetical protein